MKIVDEAVLYFGGINIPGAMRIVSKVRGGVVGGSLLACNATVKIIHNQSSYLYCDFFPAVL